MTPHVRSRARDLARAAPLVEPGGLPDAARPEKTLSSLKGWRAARDQRVPAEAVTDSRKFVQMGVFPSLARCLAILLCYELRLPIPARAFFAAIR